MRETDFATRNAVTEIDVIEFYDSYASSWDSRFCNNYATNYFLERRWRSFVDAVEYSHVYKKKAIELGVGTGVYIEKACSLFESIMAVDGSQNMIAILQGRIKKSNIDNVFTLQANATNLKKIHTANADCVYFFGLIEHIIDVSSFLMEIKRVLKKDGVVIGVTPNKNSPWYKIRHFIRQTGKHCTTDKYYSLNELNELFSSIGFHKIYSCYWGAVPAGINDCLGRFFSIIEPLLEHSFMRSLLGGITFSYRK